MKKKPNKKPYVNKIIVNSDVIDEARALGIPTVWFDDLNQEHVISDERLRYAIEQFKLKQQRDNKSASEQFKKLTDIKNILRKGGKK